MGHHRPEGGYSNSSNGHGRPPFDAGKLRRLPLGLKLLLAVVVLFIIIIIIAVALLLVLLGVKLLAGGSLPGFLQSILDFANRILQTIMPWVNTFQQLFGS